MRGEDRLFVFYGELIRKRLDKTKRFLMLSDYEILIVILTILAIIVTVLIEYIKNDRPPKYHGSGHF